MAALLDIQAVQSHSSADRGIGRYVFELAQAMERWHPGQVSRYVLNRELPVPRRLVERLSQSGRLAFQDEVAVPQGGVFHVASPLEGVRLERVWPKRFRHMRLVVTLLDLIPARWPEHYLPDPTHRRAYWTRLNIFRLADRLVTISEASAQDAVSILGLPRERIVVAGAGVSQHFRPPADREGALRALRERRSQISPGYIVYTGGGDYRKNVEGLLSAYAGLPEDLRARHQLVIVGRLSADEQSRHFHDRTEDLGIAHQVLLLGFVPEDDLVLLYQAAELFVFPSLYEGFGLPVLEAMSCGAPVIAGRNSSLVELVGEKDALFDAGDAGSIRAALERSLTDKTLLRRLRESQPAERHNWRRVAEATAGAYEDLEGRRPRARPQRRIAYVAPLLHGPSEESKDVHGLLRALQRHCRVDPFFDDGAAQAVSSPQAGVVRAFEATQDVRGGYDAVLCWLGNENRYAGALELVQRHSVVVLAREVRLTDLYSWLARERPMVERRGFHGAVQEMYSRRIPPYFGKDGGLTAELADRYGILMSQEVIGRSRRFFVRSQLEAELARVEARPGDAGKVEVLPSGRALDGNRHPDAWLWQVPGQRYADMAEHLHHEVILAP